MGDPIVEIRELTRQYGQRTALDRLSLQIQSGEIFGFLGPNGSGKTTLFRILSTLIAPTSGSVTYRFSGNSLDLCNDRNEIRRHIGVVFQSPSLDKQLTANENLRHHGHLYGMKGQALANRMSELLERVGLSDRANDRVDGFSGGMRRRVEIAKGLLNHPALLLLDEPSTGLDPGARIDLWRQLRRIQSEGVTILATTHLMEEADLCSRLAIMDRGQAVAVGSPAQLKSKIGGDVITLQTRDPQAVAKIIHDRFEIQSSQLEETVRLEYPDGAKLIPDLVAALPGMIDSVAVGKPTLQDVFIQATGYRLSQDQPDPVASSSR